MSKKHLFTTVPGAALLFVCGVACAQDDTKIAVSTSATTPSFNESSREPVKPSLPLEQKNAPSGAISQEEIVKASEAFGHFIGRNLKAPGINFNIESIIKGMRDGYAGKPAPMNDKDYEELMAKIQEKAYAELAATNLKAANDFLGQNVKAPGVVELVPGKLHYKITHPGDGAVVPEHGSPQINYVGKFIDGTSFGNSEETGGPITIPLDQTISGFSKALVGMKEGEKRMIYVHPELGYGTSGQLPPNSLLIFEVEVVKAVSPEADAASDADDLSDFSDDDFISDDDEKEEETPKTSSIPQPAKR